MCGSVYLYPSYSSSRILCLLLFLKLVILLEVSEGTVGWGEGDCQGNVHTCTAAMLSRHNVPSSTFGRAGRESRHGNGCVHSYVYAQHVSNRQLFTLYQFSTHAGQSNILYLLFGRNRVRHTEYAVTNDTYRCWTPLCFLIKKHFL